MNRINNTRFMTQNEMAEQLTAIELDSRAECKKGGIPLLVKDGKVYVDAQDNHSIIFGATGSKKTRLFGMPSVELLTRAGESFVVTDPKGEIYEKTSDAARQRGYQIYCLNLRNLKFGDTWNPLTLPYDYYNHGEKGKALEMISEFARLLAGENVQDPFWTNTATDVLTGLILILLESADREECNLKSVLELWERYLSDKADMMSVIKKNYGSSLIKRKLSSLDNESNKTVGSIEAIVATAINRIIANEEFVDFLSQEGMEFDTVTKKKTAIYLIIPDENKFYHFLTSVFMEQLYEVLIKDAQKQPECKLAIRMNYIIDEFANIPKMNNMDSMITAARSRNIRFNLIVQSKMQLEDKYGKIASVICDNCNNWIYLYSKDYGLLNEISRLCGDVIYDNHMTIPLISEFDLQHLKKEEGEALLLAGRNFPCIVNLADVDEYPCFTLEKNPKADNSLSQLLEDSTNTEKDSGQMMERGLARYPEGIRKSAVKVVYEEHQWKKVRVFNLRKPRNKNTYTYVSPKGTLSGTFRQEIQNTDTWLVGTLNGMILVEEDMTKEDAESGVGALKLCLNEFNSFKAAAELKWYVATAAMQMHYYRMAKKEPEKAFFTIEELGERYFIPVLDEKIKKIACL